MRAALVLLLAACGADVRDKTAACQMTSASTMQDRKMIGAAAPYTPDLSLVMRTDELRTSMAARRAAAWQVVERVLAPVPLATTGFTLPAWHTWYAHDDFERVFDKLYTDLGPAGRKARAPFGDATIDAGLVWNTRALDGIVDWTPQRYADYVAQVTSDDRAQGIGGANRVSYSPGATHHLLASYAKEYACRLAPEPAPYDEDAMVPGVATAAVEHVAVGDCEWHELGPYIAGAGALRVTSHGDGDADLYVRVGAPADASHFDCKSTGDASDETCAVTGAGPVYVAVFGASASTVDVEIDYTTADVRDPTCLDGEMPRDAVVVKADWRRQLDGDLLPIFDTSPDRMAQRFASTADWGGGDGYADPGPAAIYSETLPSGARYRMPAMHVMTKELDHWLWITLWWSPDPDTDFGADRPAAITGPWRNYKMCVTSDYLEADGTPSWCSNPYLEVGAGNAATNCIGCHQHGGTALVPEQILAIEPHHGTTRVRNNFFTDYSWAIKGGRGDDLSSTVQAEIDYWAATDP